MRKQIIALTASLILVVMCLCSCGADKPLEGDPAVGLWSLTKVEYMGQTIDADELLDTGAMEEMPTFEIREDGTCTFNFLDTGGDGVVTADGDGVYTLSDGAEESTTTMTFTYENDSIKLAYENMGMTMIFTK